MILIGIVRKVGSSSSSNNNNNNSSSSNSSRSSSRSSRSRFDIFSHTILSANCLACSSFLELVAVGFLLLAVIILFFGLESFKLTNCTIKI
jgi:hypothetical protein